MRGEFQRLAPKEASIGGASNFSAGRTGRPDCRRSSLVRFDVICGPPRSQADYLEIARCFHSVADLRYPAFLRLRMTLFAAFSICWTNFYDRRVKLIISADKAPEHLYTGKRLAFDFQSGDKPTCRRCNPPNIWPVRTKP